MFYVVHFSASQFHGACVYLLSVAVEFRRTQKSAGTNLCSSEGEGLGWPACVSVELLEFANRCAHQAVIRVRAVHWPC